MRRAAVLLAVVFAACGPPGPTPDGGVDAGPEQELTLGTTGPDGGFVALGGLEVDAIPGSQGGFHVNLLYTLPAGGVGTLTFDHRVVRTSDQKLVSLGTRTYDLPASGVAWTTSTPVTVFMCPTPVGVDIIGKELLFSVKAKDAAGNPVGAGSARATFRCGSAGGTFCESICKG
ncbi:MAG: hypothetical protein JNJ54_07935 [Myxococcaceae bacterium]|nr:hypothetical protein [Myxococcaceae bacterium]